MDDDTIQVRDKKLLEEIRNANNGTENDGRRRYTGYREESPSGNTQRVETNTRGNTQRTERTEQSNGATQGYDSRVRSADGQSEHTDKGPGTSGTGHKANIKFRWKLPFTEQSKQQTSKLFTKKEADEELENLQEVYFRLSGLADDLLEILVKDHEEVRIWQLDEDEAYDFAVIHLKKAQVDIDAARSARKLLEIHEKLHIYIYILPRAYATGKHIVNHKGFSFR